MSNCPRGKAQKNYHWPDYKHKDEGGGSNPYSQLSVEHQSTWLDFGPLLTQRSFKVKNSGAEDEALAVSFTEGAVWMSVTPSSVDLGTNQEQVFYLDVDRDGLSEGIYLDTLFVNSDATYGAQNDTIIVTLDVSDGEYPTFSDNFNREDLGDNWLWWPYGTGYSATMDGDDLTLQAGAGGNARAPVIYKSLIFG